MKKISSQIYIWILLILLYSPLVFIAVFSFTEAKTLGNWTGYTVPPSTSLSLPDRNVVKPMMISMKNDRAAP